MTTYADQIAASVAAIRADLNECSERLELRDEYRIAFDLWAKAVADLKGWIRDEAVALNCPPNMVLAFGHRNHWRYQELSKREKTMYALMSEAHDRCEAAGDVDWAAEQESREFDVENA
jgi:hypothetical protein